MKPDTVGRPDGRAAASPPFHTTGLWADGILLTATGERLARDLRPGDRIITRDAGMVTLRGIALRSLRAPLVRIREGSLGHRRPGRDVLLPAGQPILVRDWRARALFGHDQVLVAAARLVDGEFVTHAGCATLDFCELDFGEPHILYLDGLEVTSEPTSALVT
ncbi:hypothetical protein C6W92_11165 [Roseovarius sp. A46]|uniref:Hint domain-containing protein n=1 Tax=Roseovarius sp. A46 TaxID=2109331 RepID=UPI001012FC64|nr:Hint domain-containing protein [Roseovarius sp. A46]RXV62202.1 hypothetical protein C6W92_11165 [Roseovarius sp. A46]